MCLNDSNKMYEALFMLQNYNINHQLEHIRMMILLML